MRLSILPLLLVAGAAFAQLSPGMPGRGPAADAAEAGPAGEAPPPAARAMPSTPSRPSTASTGGEAAPAAPTASAERAPSTLSVDPRGGGWGTPRAPQVGTGLEAVMNTGVPMGQSRMLRKVCPPGLVNRDGNCVAPASAIMR